MTECNEVFHGNQLCKYEFQPNVSETVSASIIRADELSDMTADDN
jgi:hypothetical protein